MKYKLFGRSGLRVSELCLGTMTFGEDWGWGASKEDSRRIFDAYTKAGGNFIDSASLYTEGTSEEYVGDFVASDRDYFVVATKYTLRARGDNQQDPNAGGNQRKNMMRSVEASLKRLKTDYIDLFWLHMWDGMTPVEEVVRALDDLVRAGKVLYVGVSDTPAWVVSQANAIADLRGWSRFVGLQLPYHLANRDPERELFPMAQALDLAVTPWGVLGGGTLTGKYNHNGSEPRRYEEAGSKSLSAAETVMKVADACGKTPSQVSLNWVRQQQHKANIIPIVGARTPAQMEDNLGCLDFELPQDALGELEQATEFDLGFPSTFLTDDTVRGLIFGTTFEKTQNHRA